MHCQYSGFGKSVEVYSLLILQLWIPVSVATWRERERGGKVKGRGRRVKVAPWKTPVSFLHGFSSSKQRDAANRFPPALLISIPVSCDYFPFLFYKYYVFLITAAYNKFSSSRGFE